MAVRYTEEQLNSVDKPFLIQLLLQQQEQLNALTEELHAADAAYVEITVQLQQASEEEPQQSGSSQERDFQ